MRIDESGQNGGFAEVVNLGIGRHLVDTNEAGDFSVAHQDRSRPDSVRGGDPMRNESLHAIRCCRQNLSAFRPEPIVPFRLFQPFHARDRGD